MNATVLDFRIAELPADKFSDQIGLRLLHLLEIRDDENSDESFPFFILAEHTVGRVWFVPDAATPLLIMAESPDDPGAGEFLAAATRVVESMRFG